MNRQLLFLLLVATLGFSVTAVVVFQTAFLAAVIPHGGIF